MALVACYVVDKFVLYKKVKKKAKEKRQLYVENLKSTAREKLCHLIWYYNLIIVLGDF